jgi:integrase
MMQFTATGLMGLKPRLKPYEIFDNSGERGKGRLGLRINVSGLKIFIYRYYVGKSRVYVQLGELSNSYGLAEARKKAQELGALLTQGIDPKQHLLEQEAQKETDKLELAKQQQEEAKRGSIKQLFHSYTAQMKKDGKRTFIATLTALEKETYPVVPQHTKAKAVTVDNVVEILARMIQRGAVTQSNRVRSYLMAAFNHGMKHDHDPANRAVDVLYGLQFNPVTPVPKQRSAERVGENWLKLEELRLLMANFSNSTAVGFHLGKLLELCVYTGGQRPYELAASKWSAINWQQKTLDILPAVSKNKRAHLVPLTDSAIAVLKQLHEFGTSSEFIFPHRDKADQHILLGSLGKCISRFIVQTGCRKFIARDIRRTCKTLMGEMGVSKQLRDRIQNHALQDVSSKHYDRYEYAEEKRVALRNWEAWLSGEAQSNVRTLHAR